MIHCLKIKSYNLTAPVALWYFCANQHQAQKKPRLPKTSVIMHIY